ncbi:MAG: antibiotic biosynthesis monooxygenase family protein [Pseudoruegeria sp.]
MPLLFPLAAVLNKMGYFGLVVRPRGLFDTDNLQKQGKPMQDQRSDSIRASASSGLVRLQGYMDVPEERLSAVTTALVAHIDLTRKEPGCLSFDVTLSETVPRRYIVAETFVHKPAFDAHQKRTKASDWFKVTDGIPRHYEITIDD